MGSVQLLRSQKMAFFISKVQRLSPSIPKKTNESSLSELAVANNNLSKVDIFYMSLLELKSLRY